MTIPPGPLLTGAAAGDPGSAVVHSRHEAGRPGAAAAGGRLVAGPEGIPVGKLVVAEDPFGNVLVLLDLGEARAERRNS